MSELFYSSKLNRTGDWATKEVLDFFGLTPEQPPPGAVVQTITPQPPQVGPGTELAKLLKAKGYGESPSCQCKSRIREMNTRGCQWCSENIGTIVGWLREEHARQELTVPFIEWLVRRLVKKAIRSCAQP